MNENRSHNALSSIIADILREYAVEYQNMPALENSSSANKNFCRVLDIWVPKLVEVENGD